MADTPDTTSALNWIPQIFYDLIGRVVPGAAVLAASLLLFQDPAQAQSFTLPLLQPEVPQSILLLLGLLFSYLAGFLLGAVGFLFRGKEWKVSPPPLSLQKQPELGKEEICASFMYDAVQHHDPPAGARLAKLAAEQHMCRVLMAGFSLQLALQLVQLFRGLRPWAFPASLVLYAVVIASAWLSHRHLEIRSGRLLANSWYGLDLAKKTRVDSNQLA